MKLLSPPVVLFAILALLPTSSLLAQPTSAKARKLPLHGKLESVDQQAQTITVSGKKPNIFYLTPSTEIVDGSGNPSSLDAAVVGEDIRGSYTKDLSERMTLHSLRLGKKPSTSPSPTAAIPPAASTLMPASTPIPTTAPSGLPGSATTMEATEIATPAATPSTTAAPKKERFTGKVISVDPSTNTIVIHGQTNRTFTITPTTKITASTGKSVNLNNLTAETHIHGTYIQSPDGTTLTIETLKIDK